MTSDTEQKVAFYLSEGAVLLYDGDCGVCNRAVQWILRHERQHSLRFAPLQSELGKKLRALALVPAHIDSLIWVEEEEGITRGHIWSASVIACLRYVGGPWSLLALVRFVPSPLRDACYRIFARYRKAFAPKTCPLPPASARRRFIS